MRGYLASFLAWLEVTDRADELAPARDVIRDYDFRSGARPVSAHRCVPL